MSVLGQWTRLDQDLSNGWFTQCYCTFLVWLCHQNGNIIQQLQQCNITICIVCIEYVFPGPYGDRGRSSKFFKHSNLSVVKMAKFFKKSTTLNKVTEMVKMEESYGLGSVSPYPTGTAAHIWASKIITFIRSKKNVTNRIMH